MREHRIELRPADANEASYGITHKSLYVYRSDRGSYPTRVVVWSNIDRPNPRDGEPVRYGERGRIDGGDGRYLDPRRRATNAATTILLTTEEIVISARRDGTGTAASGQVWAESTIGNGDLLTLVYPDGSRAQYRAKFPWHANGHGQAVPITNVELM